MRTSGPSSCTQSSISDSSYSGDRETLVAMLMNLRSLNRVGQKETEKAGRKSEKKKLTGVLRRLRNEASPLWYSPSPFPCPVHREHKDGHPYHCHFPMKRGQLQGQFLINAYSLPQTSCWRNRCRTRRTAPVIRPLKRCVVCNRRI